MTGNGQCVPRTDSPEVIKYLYDNFTITQIVEELADRIVNQPKVNKIVISQEEYDLLTSLFKIRGVKVNGEAETRGRKRATPEDA